MKVGSAVAEESTPDVPGRIVAVGRDGIRIACGEGLLVVRSLQRPGGKMLPAAEFLAGHPMVVGEQLVSSEMPAFVADRPFPRSTKA